MKKLFIVMFVLMFTLVAGAAFAASAAPAIEGDASLVIGTAPESGWGTGIGFNVGGGMMLPQVDKNLQVRVDISYIKWSMSDFGFDVSFTRIPITASGRYYIPLQNNLKAYVQGGLELSIDKSEAVIPGFTFFGVTTASQTVSSSETNFGITPGAGISFDLNKNLSIVADARYHIITGGYLTLQAGAAYHF